MGQKKFCVVRCLGVDDRCGSDATVCCSDTEGTDAVVVVRVFVEGCKVCATEVSLDVGFDSSGCYEIDDFAKSAEVGVCGVAVWGLT